MHRTLLALALTTLPVAAAAKSPKAMSDDELLVALISDKSQGNREKAADEIGARQLETAIPKLLEACRPVEHEFVCDHALRALEQIRVPAAKEAVATVLLDERLKEWKRKTAMRVLGRIDEAYLATVAPQVLARYRSMDGDFAAPLIQSLVKGGNAAIMDLTILIATDVAAHRRARIAALDAAEAFKHPRLFDAYVALLDDSDKGLRLRCAKELGRTGLPGQVVVPPLLKVAQYDENGDVRAAAMKSLRSYASPELLPMLNVAVVNEKHPMAWFHAVQLFEVLADASSLGALDALLRNTFLMDEEQVRLCRTAVRIGDPSIISSLQTRVDDPQEVETVKTAAAEAIALLAGPPQAQVAWATALVVPEIVLWTPAVEVVMPPPLAISVDATGGVVWGGLEASVMVPGVSVQVSAP